MPKKITLNLKVAIEMLDGKKETAALLKISTHTLYRWNSGITPIPPERAIQIEKLTEGYVKRSNLRPDLWPPEQEPETSKSPDESVN